MPHPRFAATLAVTALGAGFLIAPAPLALAQPSPNVPAPTQDSAEKTIVDGYIAKQIDCTPDSPPQFESLTWYPPGFVYAVGGAGMISDANPALGGEFTATWTGSEWAVEYLYC
ncbi:MULTISPECIES: hypothetical protein [Mycobacteriaceae]|uniref:hypothetical protein n=1 Tax=Mycobacteriaceae TaxID=1762 RepID=UPI0007FD09D4|nr:MULTISPECIES: hypothetical protein [Mycobacteriaceae]MCK0174270.1 hypothetical protein [Mycolicibacterium sp. F2034L]OBB60386.1 hypothetical protein A5757_09870 [Mycobacterium sp. 852013-51886_SCH5428379]